MQKNIVDCSNLLVDFTHQRTKSQIPLPRVNDQSPLKYKLLYLLYWEKGSPLFFGFSCSPAQYLFFNVENSLPAIQFWTIVPGFSTSLKSEGSCSRLL